jgi:hypothetical protein
MRNMSRGVLAFTWFLLLVAARETESLSTHCPTTIEGAVQFHPKAFTPLECQSIVEQMKQLPVEIDHRVDKSVRRTNYFDKGTAVTCPDSKYGWILRRILSLYSPSESMESFCGRIDFILMHEFDQSGFFDWHVDTKPNDGTDRTDNINVMLSNRGDYEGGALLVGTQQVAATLGDAYSYPGSFPHKVDDITRGQRHTFIVAMKESTSTPPDNGGRQLYWDRAEENYKQLCDSSSLNNPVDPKFHMLYGEFLAALKRPEKEVDGKFADMYTSTAQAQDYAQSFLETGNALQTEGKVQEAQGYLNMAQMISSRIAAKQPQDV